MIFSEPLPFKEAIDSAKIRSLLPTTGKTVDLQKLEPDLKRRALWSATVTSVPLLQKISDGVDKILAGDGDQASVRLGLKELLARSGYIADQAEAGGMQDLSSSLRLNTIIETQVDVMRGAGWYAQGMQDEVLDEFPAQELFRAIAPRGGSDAERDWASRWARVGGQFFEGRMIALKTDDIWNKLGDPSIFPDGLGNPWPPFAFSSGMEVRDIDRGEAVALGLIGKFETQKPAPIDIGADLQASPDVRNGWLRSAIEESGLGSFDSEGTLHFTGGAL